jgi:hypothetical protein
MDLKLDFKIALKYSLFLFLYFIIDRIHLHFNLGDTYDPKSGTIFIFSILYRYVLTGLIIMSYLEYIKYRRNYKDLVVISLFIWILIYVFNFIVNFSFFKLLYEDVEVHREQGILGILNTHFVLMKPEFHFLDSQIIFPFQQLYNAVFFRDWLQLSNILFYPIFLFIIVLYHFNLFFLFKKYEENKWFSLVPVLNKWILIKIAGKPAFSIILVYVPFLSYFLMYSINKEIAAENGYDSKVTLGMTLLPAVFYGKISFDEKRELSQNLV